MNKLIRRLAMAFVGISMAVGVGVAVGSNKEAIPVHAAETTIAKTAAQIASAYSVTVNGNTVEGNAFDLDTNVHVTIGGGGNNGKFYNLTSGTANMRCYSGGSITFGFNNTGYVLKSITFVYGNTANGIKYGENNANNATSGSAVSAGNATSFTFNSTARVDITSISVTYDSASLEPSVSFDDSSLTLKTNNSNGVTKSVTASNVTGVAYLWSTNDSNITLENYTTSTVTVKPNTNEAGSATVSIRVTGSNIDTYNNSFTVTLTLPTSYSISVTETNCSHTGATSIYEGGEATIHFVADDGYTLPVSPTITGATVKSFTNGDLIIQNPTSNVSITMTAASYKNTVANIVSGGQYKIYHTIGGVKYYMVANGGTTSAQGSTTNAWEATIFTFTLTGDETITITNGTKYLYCTNNNNGVRFGDTSDSWVLSAGTQRTSSDVSTEISSGANHYNLVSKAQSRYLSVYETNMDFRSYTTANATNRLTSTEFELYNASAFAQDVLDATDTVCGVNEEHSASDFTTLWATLQSDYGYLSSSDKASFVSAERNESGTVLEQGAARYDRVCGKYSLTNFATGRTPSAGARVAGLEMTSNNSALLVIVIASTISLIAVSSYFVIRRRKENN